MTLETLRRQEAKGTRLTRREQAEYNNPSHSHNNPSIRVASPGDNLANRSENLRQNDVTDRNVDAETAQKKKRRETETQRYRPLRDPREGRRPHRSMERHGEDPRAHVAPFDVSYNIINSDRTTNEEVETDKCKQRKEEGRIGVTSKRRLKEGTRKDRSRDREGCSRFREVRHRNLRHRNRGRYRDVSQTETESEIGEERRKRDARERERRKEAMAETGRRAMQKRRMRHERHGSMERSTEMKTGWKRRHREGRSVEPEREKEAEKRRFERKCERTARDRKSRKNRGDQRRDTSRETASDTEGATHSDSDDRRDTTRGRRYANKIGYTICRQRRSKRKASPVRNKNGRDVFIDTITSTESEGELAERCTCGRGKLKREKGTRSRGKEQQRVYGSDISPMIRKEVSEAGYGKDQQEPVCAIKSRLNPEAPEFFASPICTVASSQSVSFALPPFQTAVMTQPHLLQQPYPLQHCGFDPYFVASHSGVTDSHGYALDPVYPILMGEDALTISAPTLPTVEYPLPRLNVNAAPFFPRGGTTRAKSYARQIIDFT